MSTPVLTEEDYDDFLDSVYPEVTIGYSTFSASSIVRKLDPFRYQEGFNEWAGTEEEDEDE